MIVIFGGGVAGASLAHALVRRGAQDVFVYDPNPPGAGSTVRATGGFRTQFASSLNIELSLASRPFFAGHADRTGFRPNGYAFIPDCNLDCTRLSEWRELQVAAGLPVESASVSRLFPGFRFGDGCCNFCSLDGVYEPASVLRLFREEAAAGGARFAYEADTAQIAGHADTVVVAAGNWSAAVAATFGVHLSVTPQERHVWSIDGAPVGPGMPLGVDMGSGWVFREREGLLLAVSPAGLDDPDAELRQWLGRRLSIDAMATIKEHWTGFYDNSFDLHPLVGEAGRVGVWVSCGFSGHGIMHAPAIADSLAAMMLGETPPIDITRLSPRRTIPLLDPTQI